MLTILTRIEEGENMYIPELKVQPGSFCGLPSHKKGKHIWYISQLTGSWKVTF
jgi:hypothetical protein